MNSRPSRYGMSARYIHKTGRTDIATPSNRAFSSHEHDVKQAISREAMPVHNLDELAFLRGDGEMRARIRAHDWAGTPLGPARQWPGSLRSVVSLMLASKLPMYIAVGLPLTFLYNDSYIRILGAKHPGALGQDIANVWAEIWSDLKPPIERALAGEATFARDMPRKLKRHDVEEQTYFTFSTSAFLDDDAHVAGVFCACQETTADVHARAASTSESEGLREMFSKAPSFMAVLRGPSHVFEIANEACLQMVGKRDLIGTAIRTAFPDVEGQGFFEALDRVYTTGEAVVGRRRPVSLRGASANPDSQLLLDFVLQPLRDPSGRITGIFIEGSDVTEAARADERRIESERFIRATIDALAEHIAVVDSTGLILAVNKAWRDFGVANGAVPAAVSEGANYLLACERSAERGVQDAGAMATLIREIASGKRDIATLEYQCHSPSDERWFSVRITRFSGEGPVYLVISHENITARKKSDLKIEHLATHDSLTSLPNRNLLNDRTAQALDHSRQSGLGVAMFFLDLDNFKHLNDAFGHAVGDAVLDAIARELRGIVRAGDTVARLGGDEFAILLNDLRDAPLDAARLAQGITDRLSRPRQIGQHEIYLTASIGISLFPADGNDVDELLKSADAAMYAAKTIGPNSFQFYASHMSARVHERLAIEADLRHAIRHNQFELYYQPQVQTATGAIVGIEALIRWRHPKLGMVSPARFIPVAEEIGLIIPIGEWVLRAACKQSKLWQAERLSALPVAVNISAVQLRQPDFVDMVARILQETGLDADCLELEITESMVMSRTESMIGRLRDLKALGVALSIDDFGTGYSNLSYLKSFPLDRLKIDQSFIRDLPSDPQAVSIVSAIIAMAQSLDLQVIAEGVETAEQAKCLDGIGCEQSQGYLYSFPLDATAFETWFRKRETLGREALAH